MRCHGAGLRCSCGFHSLHVIRAQSEGIRRPEMRRFPDRARKRLPIRVVRKERTLDVIAMGFFPSVAERFQRAQRARSSSYYNRCQKSLRIFKINHRFCASNFFKQLKLQFSSKYIFKCEKAVQHQGIKDTVAQHMCDMTHLCSFPLM